MLIYSGLHIFSSFGCFFLLRHANWFRIVYSQIIICASSTALSVCIQCFMMAKFFMCCDPDIRLQLEQGLCWDMVGRNSFGCLTPVVPLISIHVYYVVGCSYNPHLSVSLIQTYFWYSDRAGILSISYWLLCLYHIQFSLHRREVSYL